MYLIELIMVYYLTYTFIIYLKNAMLFIILLVLFLISRLEYHNPDDINGKNNYLRCVIDIVLAN